MRGSAESYSTHVNPLRQLAFAAVSWLCLSWLRTSRQLTMKTSLLTWSLQMTSTLLPCSQTTWRQSFMSMQAPCNQTQWKVSYQNQTGMEPWTSTSHRSLTKSSSGGFLCWYQLCLAGPRKTLQNIGANCLSATQLIVGKSLRRPSQELLLIGLMLWDYLSWTQFRRPFLMCQQKQSSHSLGNFVSVYAQEMGTASGERAYCEGGKR